MKELQSAFQRSLADGEIVTFAVPQSQEGDLPEVTLAKINAVLNELRSIGLAARQRSGVLLDEGGVLRQVKRAKLNQAAATADGELVALVAGYAIRVLAVYALTGGTATDLTFQSNATAISALLANDARGGEVLPYNPHGWFQTAVGEALKVTTGAGATTGLHVSYILVPNYLTDENGVLVTDEDGNALTA